MHWQPADPSRPSLSLAGPLLHLWWWAPERQPTMAERRARIDAILRRTLAAYVGRDPAALRFARERKGRPYLRHDSAPDFNLTDTEGGTLVAVCRGARVGVDIERLGRAVSSHSLARRWFAPEESAALDRLDGDTARRVFLRLWTAKEAACKATGTGIYGWLSQWRFDPGRETPRLLAAPADAGEVGEWSFLRISPPGDAHTAVLAARGTLPTATCLIASPG